MVVELVHDDALVVADVGGVVEVALTVVAGRTWKMIKVYFDS